MITSSGNADWPGDVPLQDLKGAGLSVPCRVRLKLFTLDSRLIVRKTGVLGAGDRDALGRSMRMALPL